MKKFLTGFIYAINGLHKAIVSELNLKVQLVIAVCVVLLGIMLHLSPTEWVVIIGCIGGVITAEMFNTAIEKIVDMIFPMYNPQAGLIKDIAAGAVLAFAITSAIVACVIFVPKILIVFL